MRESILVFKCVKTKKVKVFLFFCHGTEGEADMVVPLHDNELLEDWWIEWSWKICKAFNLTNLLLPK